MGSTQEKLPESDSESGTLGLDTLESHLWEAADILRGSIDAADYKNYIFGLLFLKRINDRFEEETEEIAAEYDVDKETVRGDRDLHEEFWVPERARWDHITAQSTDIGATLNKALAAVEDENNAISDRVLTSVDFNDKDRLSDATLEELVTHFSTHRYRNEDLDDPDIFGRAYEYLIRQFADDAGKKGGEFYTPREVVQLLVECVNPRPGDRVYDPACGSAGMLIYSAQHVEDEGGDRDNISLYGQEKNLNTWAIGQMNVLLHELQDTTIEKGDTITDPQFVTEHDELEVFDRVVANPPWNDKKWNKGWVQENEPYSRFDYGLPPKNRGDWAWIQLMVSSLTEDGKAGIVMDNGVLFRSRSEKKIRKPFLEDDLIEAVIALPENLFYNTGSSGCLVIFNKDKPAERKDKVLFVYAEDQELRESGVQVYEELSSQNQLTREGVKYVAETFLTGREEEHHSRLVGLEEIAENDYNLNVPRYVDTTEPEEPIDVSEKLEELDRLAEKREQTEAELEEYLGKVRVPISNSCDIDAGSYKTVEIGPKKFTVPDSWELKRIPEVCDLSTKSFEPDKHDGETFEYIDIESVSSGKIEKSKTTKVEEAPSRAKQIVEEGDTLIGKVRPYLRAFAPVTEEYDGYICSTGFAVLSAGEEIDPRYLTQAILSKYFLDQMTNKMTGTSYPSVNKSDFESVQIFVPPLPEQKQIADILSTVDRSENQIRKMRDETKELKRGLMQDLLTGRHNVETDT